MQFPIIIGLRRSFLLDAVLGLVALLASVMCLAYPGPMALKAPLLASVLIVAALAWLKFAPIGLRLRMDRDGRLSLQNDLSSDFFPVTLLSGAVVHPWLTVIRLRSDAGRIFALVAVADSLEVEDFRHLRVFLRWRAKINRVESA